MSYAYPRRVPTVSTYNGIGGGSFATERTTEWNIPVASPYDGVGLGDDEEDTWMEILTGGGGDVDEDFKDPLAPPKTGGGVTPVTPPKTPTPVTPPKTPTPVTPMTTVPNVLAAPPAASSGGLSTMTLVGGGLASLAVVGGLVYWKKKKGGRR